MRWSVAHNRLRHYRAAQTLCHHMLRRVPLLQVGHLREHTVTCSTPGAFDKLVHAACMHPFTLTLAAAHNPSRKFHSSTAEVGEGNVYICIFIYMLCM